MDLSVCVSVIIPVRNEARSIRRTLSAVLDQDYPAERLEVLVADGMSTDGTPEIAAHMLAGRPHTRLLENPGKIVPTGLNAALRQAQGEIIVRVDGHTQIAPDYVRQCVLALQHSGADNVGGVMIAVGQNPFAQSVTLATSSPFGVGGARFHYSTRDEWVDTVYLGAWPKRVFEQIGLFDEELVRDQDDEFNYRLREHGGRILLSQSIHSQYSVRSTQRALWKQYYQYGFWKVRVLQKHPRQMRPRQFIPPGFVLTLIVLAAIALLMPGVRVLFVSIAGLYLLANLAASLWLAAKNGWRYVLLLPIVFGILHFSYGLGFLWGLVRFANRWGDREGLVPSWQPSRCDRHGFLNTNTDLN